MALNNLFVYGTLMVGCSNHRLLEPYLLTVQLAHTQGLLFDLPDGYPAMADGDGVVKGELVTLANVDAALLALDQLEEYYGKDCSDNLYNRVNRSITIDGGSAVQAYVYLWAKPSELDRIGLRIPSGDWKRMNNYLLDKIEK